MDLRLTIPFTIVITKEKSQFPDGTSTISRQQIWQECE